MVIKNKDGTVYTLRSPNPLGKTQDFWEIDKLVFHNCQWNDIVMADDYVLESPHHQEYEEPQHFIASPQVQETVTIEPEPEPKWVEEKEPEAIEEQVAEDFNFPHLQHKVIMHCLPATIIQKSDDFYGDTWGRVKYGKKFVLPSVMIQSNDLEIIFWTSDPNDMIKERSVVYPFAYEVYNKDTKRYDRVPYNEYRWWKVTEKEPKDGGFVFKAVISDFQPDFSD